MKKCVSLFLALLISASCSVSFADPNKGASPEFLESLKQQKSFNEGYKKVDFFVPEYGWEQGGPVEGSSMKQRTQTSPELLEPANLQEPTDPQKQQSPSPEFKVRLVTYWVDVPEKYRPNFPEIANSYDEENTIVEFRCIGMGVPNSTIDIIFCDGQQFSTAAAADGKWSFSLPIRTVINATGHSLNDHYKIYQTCNGMTRSNPLSRNDQNAQLDFD